MINDMPLSRFQPFGSALLKPIYNDYSFGNIPNTIHYLLTSEQLGPLLPADCFGGAYPSPEKIVLFFIDSFGWQFWLDHHERFPAMRRVTEDGVLTPISALFPSTTSASVTTMCMGVLPAVHALYEWNIYIPAYGEVIQCLPFRPLGSDKKEACLAKGYDPADMLAVRETIHQRLARHGVRSIQFANLAYVDSSYNRMVNAGAEVIRHATLAEMLVQVREALDAVKGKAFLGTYWASIDSIAHLYGPGTPYHAAEIAGFWQTFEAVLGGVRAENALFLFIADHGQVRGVAAETVALNERLPWLRDCLAPAPNGSPILPNGSPRDVFLHVRPERRAEVLGALSDLLAGVAAVMPMEHALREGLFGPEPVSAELRARLGDVLILPYDGQFVWWREPGVLENRFNGHHGGLAAPELITAFGAAGAL
jgi:hypothetical protein